jgi:hypothetical protein
MVIEDGQQLLIIDVPERTAGLVFAQESQVSE